MSNADSGDAITVLRDGEWTTLPHGEPAEDIGKKILENQVVQKMLNGIDALSGCEYTIEGDYVHLVVGSPDPVTITVHSQAGLIVTPLAMTTPIYTGLVVSSFVLDPELSRGLDTFVLALQEHHASISAPQRLFPDVALIDADVSYTQADEVVCELSSQDNNIASPEIQQLEKTRKAEALQFLKDHDMYTPEARAQIEAVSFSDA